jgi:Eukaryotic aspartyl protease
MITLFEQKQLPHKFALAVSRGETNSSDGGIFIIGDLPDLLDPRVNATNDFASVALLATVDFLKTTTAWYAITVESLYYGTFGNMFINSTAGNYIVDSDASVIVLPADDIERWMVMFDPSMPFNSKTLEVNCNATISILEFRIGGKLFPMNPVDLIIRNPDGTRSSTVQAGLRPLYWLGDRFQRNALADYDLENEQMQ